MERTSREFDSRPEVSEHEYVMLNKIFYGLPDKFVIKTDARFRRAMNFWLLVFWLLPGSLLWFLLKDALWFIGFMSLYALWATHFGAFSAETPVENE